MLTYKRHGIHVERIRNDQYGLYVGSENTDGPAGWCWVRSDGAVQLEDGGPYLHLPRCNTTGALILPDSDDGE